MVALQLQREKEFSTDNNNFMRLLLFIFSFAFLVSCSKEVKKADIADVAGDYEWFHSTDGVFESIYPSSTEDKYGIRIKSTSRVKFYKNAEEIYSFKIYSLSETPSGGKEILFEWSDLTLKKVTIEGSTLTISDWPFAGYSNSFLIHD